MRAFIAFASFVAVAAMAEAATPVATVELSNFKFSPAIIQLHAGTPVVLHLANTGSGSHNFTAPQFFAAARLDPQAAALVHALDDVIVTGAEGGISATSSPRRSCRRCANPATT